MEEQEKLDIVLHHWIEHNQEHSQEFREWAGKAKAAGAAEIYADIIEAAQQLEKATEALSRAARRLAKDQP